ncbi:MAG TPA: hypothetical protein VF765_16080 [Polyangiaceae bacterium]
MIRATRFAFSMLAAMALVGPLFVSPAHAEPPSSKAQPVYVLAIQTDDADDQADALTQALRWRVRQAQGWSLLESPQSFEMLSIALKCPPRPDANCLQKIGDQLHADRYMWGTMVKRPAGQVTADLHMWTRGKGDSDVAEAYSDNLKDASDESLRGVASRLFAKLTGGVSGGTVTIHAGTAKGTVLVDGTERGSLDGGVARLDVPAGSHTITVKVPGFDAQPQTATVAMASDQDMNFTLTPAGAPPPEPSSGPSARKVGEWTAIVVGGGLMAAGAVMGVKWIIDFNHGKDLQNKVSKDNLDACATQDTPDAQQLCQTSHTVQTDYTLGWVLGGAGAAVLGTGLLLLVTDHSTKDEAPAAEQPPQAKPRLDVIPQVGATGASMGLRVTF